MIRNLFCTFLLFQVFSLYSQELKTSDEFLNHLLNQELSNDAIYYLENELLLDSSLQISKDSIHYLLGKLYEKKDIEISSHHFESIKWSNKYLIEAKKKQLIYQYIELDQLELIDSINTYQSTGLWEDACDSLYVFEAIRVLNSESRTEADQICSNLDWNLINDANNTLMKYRRKSAFKAGMLSAVVPGLGKVYAGRSGQGIMAFVTSAVLGWQAVEGYQKGGVNDVRFIVFTSLFGINYIGNIWGSALSVSVNYQNHYNESKNALLASIRFGITF